MGAHSGGGTGLVCVSFADPGNVKWPFSFWAAASCLSYSQGFLFGQCKETVLRFAALGTVQSFQGTILNISYVRMAKNSNNDCLSFLSKL